MLNLLREQHLLPNFNECWWDRWLLDVLICNNIGIVAGAASRLVPTAPRWLACFTTASSQNTVHLPLFRAGMHTVRYFRAKKFNWLGLSQQPSLTAKVRRAAGQFLPWSYENFDWQLTSGVCVVHDARTRALYVAHTDNRAPPLPALCCSAASDDGLRAERFPAEARSLDSATKRFEHVPPVHLGWCVLRATVELFRNSHLPGPDAASHRHGAPCGERVLRLCVMRHDAREAWRFRVALTRLLCS